MRLPLLSSRASRFTESVIRGMSVEARRHKAINLAQGMPDFPAPDPIKQAACNAILADHNQYATTWGVQSLREALAEHVLAFRHITIDPDREITVTCGSTEAMLVALLALINPGDEVILSQPYYENYWPDCVLAGAAPRFVPLRRPGWRYDPDELADAFNNRTKAIILCNPNNPTGTVLDRPTLEHIARLCRKWDVIAITDEIYEHIIYDQNQHIMLAALEGMRDRSITISGMSKTFSVTGWRVGTMIASPEITRALRQVHDFVTIGAAAPLQEAGAVAYRLPPDYFQNLAREYQARRDLLCDGLEQIGFALERPQGAYYVLADFSALVGEPVDDTAFAHRLVREIGVAVVPGSSFYRDPTRGRKLVRFAFCKQTRTLETAVDRLRNLAALA
jgi:aminotransferase